jgi:DNA-binding transcriptional MerR regulator
MAYTVKKLAKLSGLGIRTLRFYEEIRLLKPAYYGDNNYRYYEEAQLLMLQQILFFRELGFSLKDIQTIISSPDFDEVATLQSHRKTLEKNLNQTKVLIETVDKTIAHLRGGAKIKDEELYYGFDSEKQRRYEQELVESGKVTESEMKEYRKQYQNWTREQKDQFTKEGGLVNIDLIKAINNHLLPSSDEVQAIIRRHYALLGGQLSKEKYIGFAQMYQTPEFKKFYDAHDPRLLAFLVEAIRIFAERELS